MRREVAGFKVSWVKKSYGSLPFLYKKNKHSLTNKQSSGEIILLPSSCSFLQSYIIFSLDRRCFQGSEILTMSRIPSTNPCKYQFVDIGTTN